MKPYYQDSHVTIYHADALDLLITHSLQGIGGCIMDPPYASGGRNPSVTRRDYATGEWRPHWFAGDNMGTDTYLWWMREIGGLLFQCCSPGAHLYCFTDWRQYGTLTTALESKRWTLSNCIVWAKARGGAMGSFWRNDHELIPVFTKGAPTELPNHSYYNVITASKPQAGEHPTVKPIGLISRLVSATQGTIIDPFMGSGTTLRAAKDLGRKAIGIEIEERYCEIAAKRMSQLAMDLA